jgi:hypothetical protein
VRGVSGGERKRVSIAEASLTGAKFQCWDNSTNMGVYSMIQAKDGHHDIAAYRVELMAVKASWNVSVLDFAQRIQDWTWPISALPSAGMFSTMLSSMYTWIQAKDGHHDIAAYRVELMAVKASWNVSDRASARGYSGLDVANIRSSLCGDVLYNAELDVHLAHLTVGARSHLQHGCL